MKKQVWALMLALSCALPAAAQQGALSSFKQLIEDGYEIKAFGQSSTSRALFLQKGKSVYSCLLPDLEHTPDYTMIKTKAVPFDASLKICGKLV